MLRGTLERVAQSFLEALSTQQLDLASGISATVRLVAAVANLIRLSKSREPHKLELELFPPLDKVVCFSLRHTLLHIKCTKKSSIFLHIGFGEGGGGS